MNPKTFFSLFTTTSLLLSSAQAAAIKGGEVQLKKPPKVTYYKRNESGELEALDQSNPSSSTKQEPSSTSSIEMSKMAVPRRNRFLKTEEEIQAHANRTKQIVDKDGQWTFPVLRMIAEKKKAMKARVMNESVISGLMPLRDLIIPDDVKPAKLSRISDEDFNQEMDVIFHLLSLGDGHTWTRTDLMFLFDFARRIDNVNAFDMFQPWVLEQMALQLGELMRQAAREELKFQEQQQEQIDEMIAVVEELKRPGSSWFSFQKSADLKLHYLKVYSVAFREKLAFLHSQVRQTMNGITPLLQKINEELRRKAEAETLTVGDAASTMAESDETTEIDVRVDTDEDDVRVDADEIDVRVDSDEVDALNESQAALNIGESEVQEYPIQVGVFGDVEMKELPASAKTSPRSWDGYTSNEGSSSSDERDKSVDDSAVENPIHGANFEK